MFRTTSIFAMIAALIGQGVPEMKARRIAAGSKRLRYSRHDPHQGAQECARRVRQRANGTHGL